MEISIFEALKAEEAIKAGRINKESLKGIKVKAGY